MVSEITFSILVSILLSICLYFYYKSPTKIKTKGVSFETLLTFLKTITKLHYFDFKNKNVEHYKEISKSVASSSLNLFNNIKNIISTLSCNLCLVILQIVSVVLLILCTIFINVISAGYKLISKFTSFVNYMFAF